jgi:hypothetical protein
MSDPKDNGGPAFPQLEPNSAYFNATGMTLRDYFAGQVIASVKGWHPADRQGKSSAQIAYEIADAMLEARK